MSDWEIEIIGLVAATLTTLAFVPQVFKIWKKRSAKGVSVSMYLIMLIGISMWFWYGVLINSIAVMAANLVSGVLQLFIIVFALLHRKKN
ncbi:MAG: SemiSWEET transporter [Flavobacteriaceae bacterium]|jgi:MtN3 and saliva related transmembrane protein